MSKIQNKLVPVIAYTKKQSEIRYAVIDKIHNEVLSANHKVIGEAFNSRDEDYIPITGLIVVATLDDIILGEVNRKGCISKSTVLTLKTIWDGPKNIWFVPQPKSITI